MYNLNHEYIQPGFMSRVDRGAEGLIKVSEHI